MRWITLLALFASPLVEATPTPRGTIDTRNDATFELKGVKPFLSRRDLNITDTIFILKEVGAATRSSRALLSDAGSDTTPLTSIENGLSYAIDVQLSDQSFELIFDTGSSDLWVAQSGFICVNSNGNPVSEARCDLGKLFSGTFEEGKVPNEHINIPYGSGEVVAGVLGYEDVTVAGVTVDHQEIGLVQEAYFIGDGVTSGILGFAYSALTSAYKGKDLGGYAPTNLVHYTNFIGNVVKQGKIDPVFSVVLERGSGKNSQVALGGLPTVSFDQDFTTVPLEIYEYTSNNPTAAKKYTYYTIEVDGFVLNSNDIGGDLHVVIDTGTTVSYLPAALARTINRAFNPPARLVSGMWEVKCDATPPKFAISIGGTDFTISAEEMLPPQTLSQDPSTGLCLTGIQSSSGTPPVLGGTLLKNVVAVFDIGAAEMRFAPHVNY